MENMPEVSENTEEIAKATIPKTNEKFLKYLRDRYNNNEDYHKKQLERANKRYEKNKEIIKDKLKNDEEYKKKRAEQQKKYYSKIRDSLIEQRKEAKEKRKQEKNGVVGVVFCEKMRRDE